MRIAAGPVASASGRGCEAEPGSRCANCAVDTTTPAGEAMANILATFAQFERPADRTERQNVCPAARSEQLVERPREHSQDCGGCPVRCDDREHVPAVEGDDVDGAAGRAGADGQRVARTEA